MTQMGRASPGPAMMYAGDGRTSSPAPMMYADARTGSPGPQAAYAAGRASPGPGAAYNAGRASPGPQAAYGGGRASPGTAGSVWRGDVGLRGCRARLLSTALRDYSYTISDRLRSHRLVSSRLLCSYVPDAHPHLILILILMTHHLSFGHAPRTLRIPSKTPHLHA
ncbi:hypothetical protein B0H14DRAFT_558323 [Mycena olivaceomarginata]|nr:hypothetical protein B0H14DRAFT_558323 [Mycena olivaceomarginata]